jgi:hypothetical protein
MQTYYAVGYVHALEKLGMVDKTSAPAAVQKVMGLVSKGGRQGVHVSDGVVGLHSNLPSLENTIRKTLVQGSQGG